MAANGPGEIAVLLISHGLCHNRPAMSGPPTSFQSFRIHHSCEGKLFSVMAHDRVSFLWIDWLRLIEKWFVICIATQKYFANS